MLGWFVDEDVISRVVSDNKNTLIEETEIEVRPERIPRKCLHENVCIGKIRKYFAFDAWILVIELIEIMQRKGIWTCKSCSSDLHAHESINCDSCLEWHHWKCVGLLKPPKAKYWFCRSYYASVEGHNELN